MKNLLFKAYNLPIINELLEFVFCIIHFILLVIFNRSGGRLNINVDGYAIFFKGYAIGKIAYQQVFTYWVMCYCLFLAIIDIYSIRFKELRKKLGV